MYVRMCVHLHIIYFINQQHFLKSFNKIKLHFKLNSIFIHNLEILINHLTAIPRKSLFRCHSKTIYKCDVFIMLGGKYVQRSPPSEDIFMSKFYDNHRV